MFLAIDMALVVIALFALALVAYWVWLQASDLGREVARASSSVNTATARLSAALAEEPGEAGATGRTLGTV